MLRTILSNAFNAASLWLACKHEYSKKNISFYWIAMPSIAIMANWNEFSWVIALTLVAPTMYLEPIIG
jgi:hypothetical protein